MSKFEEITQVQPLVDEAVLSDTDVEDIATSNIYNIFAIGMGARTNILTTFEYLRGLDGDVNPEVHNKIDPTIDGLDAGRTFTKLDAQVRAVQSEITFVQDRAIHNLRGMNNGVAEEFITKEISRIVHFATEELRAVDALFNFVTTFFGVGFETDQ